MAIPKSGAPVLWAGISFRFNAELVLVIPPIALGHLQHLQERIQSQDGTLSAANIGTIVEVALAAMARNYPELTRDELGTLIDVGNMFEVWTCVMDASGLKRKQQEDAAAGKASAPTTGAASTPS